MKKRCSNCEEIKSYSEFHKNKAQKDGHNPWCKVCRSLYLIEQKKTETREVSTKLCECGCGQYTLIAKKDSKSGGVKKGESNRFLPRHFGGPKKIRRNPEAKSCPGCGKFKGPEEFSKGTNRTDGLSYQCKVCNSAYLRENAKINPELKRTRRSQDYQKNSERYRTEASRWKKENRMQATLNNIHDRARKKEAKGTFTLAQLKFKLEYYDFKCWICNKQYEAMDHVKPLNLGGTNFISNIRPICKSCNGCKGERWYGVENIERIICEVRNFKQNSKRKVYKKSLP